MNRRELLWSAHCVTSSVIIDDLDLVSVAITPYKTDPPLVVDSKCCAGLGDRRRVPRADFPEVPGARRSCNDCALFSIASFRRATFLDAAKPQTALADKERFRVPGPEGPYHLAMLLLRNVSIQRRSTVRTFGGTPGANRYYSVLAHNFA